MPEMVQSTMAPRRPSFFFTSALFMLRDSQQNSKAMSQ